MVIMITITSSVAKHPTITGGKVTNVLLVLQLLQSVHNKKRERRRELYGTWHECVASVEHTMYCGVYTCMYRFYTRNVDYI